MSDADRVAVSTYRRRVLAVGVALAAVLAAVGAPWFLDRVENDLAARVQDRLSESGIVEAGVVFAGQDGTIRCVSPIAEPGTAREVALTVHGVRSIEVERSCRTSSAPTVATTVPGTDPPEGTTVVPEDTSVPDRPAFDSLADVIASDPAFTIFATMVAEADLEELLAPGRELTLFVPTDTAFDAWPPDALAEVRSDPELLRRVVLHHLTDGVVASTDLRDGTLPSLDGGTLVVERTTGLIGDPPRPITVVTVGGAAVVTPDLTATDGVAHSIDAIVLPSDVELEALSPVPVVSARFEDGVITLAGTVEDELRRAALVAVAGRSVDASNVDDGLAVDGAALDAEDRLDADRFASFSAAMERAAVDLGAGSVELLDGAVVVRGTYVDDAARDRLTALADLGVALDLSDRPVAGDESATVVDAATAELLTAAPIVFEPGSAEIAEVSAAVLDRLAGVIRRYAGLVVTVSGHTDSVGSAAANQLLSELRAEAVVDELVVRGVPAEQLRSVGFGSAEPILVDGIEDRDASRRVEFSAVAALP